MPDADVGDVVAVPEVDVITPRLDPRPPDADRAQVDAGPPAQEQPSDAAAATPRADEDARIPGDEAPAAVPSEPRAPNDSPARREPAAEIGAGSEREEQQSPLVFATSAAALAAGVILTLDRLRHARLRRREPGTRIPLPEAEAAAAEHRLRTLADDGLARFIDLALRELAGHSGGGRVPLVVLVSHDADDVAVHLAGAREDPPESWEAQDGGGIWVRRRPADLSEMEESAGIPSRLPALVTLGTLDDGRTALLNLAQAGCLHLDGDDETIAEMLRAWAVELATTPRADALDVMTHGVDGLPSDLERLQAVDDDDALQQRLAAPALGDPQLPTTVVLVSSDSSDLPIWIRVATEQRGDFVAVVAAPPPRPAAWAIEFDDDRACLHPEDLSFTPLHLGRSGFDQIPQLLDQAKDEDDRPVPIPPLPDDELIVLERDSEAEQTTGVRVRILGKVDVEGAGPLTTNKTMELVVYLAMHRDGADADTLLEALWPDQTPRPARLYTEASRARKALGTAPDGSPYLAEAEMGIYRLSSAMALDYEAFQSHIYKARQDAHDAERHLRAALDLVRGAPLSKTATEYAWSVNDSYRIAQEVADAAHKLVQLLLEAERYDDAKKAAEDGLKADPTSEVLIRDLMEIAAATGNRTCVHSLMTRLRRQLAEDGDANDADDYLHPETLATFERLASSERPRSAPD